MIKRFPFLLILIAVLAMAGCTNNAGSNAAVTAVATAPAAATSSQSPTEIAIETPAPTEMAAVVENTVTAEDQAVEMPQATEEVFVADLPVIGPAPAWGNDVWINTEEALPLEDLRGKVVLLEFWTFG